MTNHLAALALLLLGPAASVLAAGPPAGPPNAIDPTYETFRKAYQTLDAGLAASLYAEKALYLAPESEIRQGRSAIQPFFEKLFAGAREGGASLDIHFEFTARDREGDLAYDVGIYTVTSSAGGKVTHSSRGKFVTVLRRETDGRWRFVVDSYNSLPKPAAQP
jgi:uncharacterized protein (TIGR02246 family)